MWNTQITLNITKSQVDLFVRELLQETSRLLVLVISGSLALVYLFVVLTWPLANNISMFILFILLIIITGSTFHLLPHWPIPALAGWLTGLAILLAGAIEVFQLPGLSALFLLFPFMGVIMIGWSVGPF